MFDINADTVSFLIAGSVVTKVCSYLCVSSSDFNRIVLRRSEYTRVWRNMNLNKEQVNLFDLVSHNDPDTICHCCLHVSDDLLYFAFMFYVLINLAACLSY